MDSGAVYDEQAGAEDTVTVPSGVGCASVFTWLNCVWLRSVTLSLKRWRMPTVTTSMSWSKWSVENPYKR